MSVISGGFTMGQLVHCPRAHQENLDLGATLKVALPVQN